MTRCGSLAYYLAAWVCGCSFMGTFLWVANSNLRSSSSAGAFFFVLYFALLYGAATSLLFGFVLRRSANLLHWSRTWHWHVGGAILAPALIALLSTIVAHTPLTGWSSWLLIAIETTRIFSAGHYRALLLTIIPGVATAWILFRIHRAFTNSSLSAPIEFSAGAQTGAPPDENIRNASGE